MGSDVWLTALSLNRRHRDVMWETRSIQRLHARICGSVVGLPSPDGGRMLWSHPKPSTLLVQTGAPVSPLAFPAGYLIDQPRSANVAERLSSLVTGQRVTWSLIANPIKSTHVVLPDGTRGKKQIRTRVDDADGWLARRLDGALHVTRVAGSELGRRSGWRENTGGAVTHAYHLWTGEATVVDPERVAGLVRAGVGHAKAYGCGLLVIT